MVLGRHTLSSPSIREKNILSLMRLDVKFAIMGAGCVLMTALALVVIAVWQSGQYNTLAQHEVDGLIQADLDHITQGVYNLVQTENEAVQLHVDDILNMASHLLDDAGSVSLSNDSIEWTAVNQITNESETIDLPKFLIGNAWVGKTSDPTIKSPIVDDLTRLFGETATLFQRINDRGDMLRVATTVQTSENKRAIGTYIPAVNPDGSPNPVISTILRNETYHGRAYVVNAWYLTAYKPIKDQDGRLVGMLYVGIKQKTVESRVRQAILQIKIGKTGYVYVLDGSKEHIGRYIISYKGERDGEDIWSVKDSDGNFITQEVTHRAMSLKPGEMATLRYRWQNPGETTPRWKIARLAYYKPWDWVIGTSVYEDELQVYQSLLSSGRFRMTYNMGLAAILITVLVGMLFIFITWKITRPVRQMTRMAEKVIAGDMNQVVDVTSHDEIGILARTFNLMTDQLNQSMEKLRQREEQYRGIFEHAMEGLFQTTIEGNIFNANPAMAEILGYDSPKELISSVTDIRNQLYVNPDKRDDFIATISTHGKTAEFEVQFYRKDKTRIWVSINARMVYNESGRPALIEGFFTDITSRKKAEEEKLQLESRLTQTQKMEAIGTLAGGIAHDFNNILSAIIGFTELAMINIGQQEKALEDLEHVLKSSTRARELVKQILAFSRMTATELSPLSLRIVITDFLKMLRSVIPSTIEIKSKLTVTGLVKSDTTQIHQILMNLCTNAAHAMEEKGGILEVGLHEITFDKKEQAPDPGLLPGSYVIISVRDTGKGIPSEIMDKIFEPYFTTKEQGRGTGLGLSVIHGIIKSHRGAITCKSTINKGTTFDVYLPGLEKNEVRLTSPMKRPLPSGHERILLVDDEQILLDLGTDMLSRMGYTVITKKNSIEALDLFRADPQAFDLIITDMTMPNMTGDQLAKEMMAIRPDIPVILCTGFHEHISEKSAKEMGIKEFILKPLDMRTLTETVRNVLDRTSSR